MGLDVIHFPAQELLGQLKALHQAAGLTLSRCGIDQPALCRLENGNTRNPTLDTLWRYAAAVGQRLVLSVEVIGNTRPRVAPLNARRALLKKATTRRKKKA